MKKILRSTVSMVVILAAFAFTGCKEETIIGLPESTKYGSITVKIEGNRPDNGEPFTATQVFRYMPSSQQFDNSSIYRSTYYNEINVTRYYGVVSEDESFSQNSATLYVYEDTYGGSDFEGSYFDFTTYISTKDKKYFVIDQNFNIDATDLTSYTYDETTGKFKVNFERELGDLTVTVTVDVTVFENISPR